MRTLPAIGCAESLQRPPLWRMARPLILPSSLATVWEEPGAPKTGRSVHRGGQSRPAVPGAVEAR
eukprot:688665-Lingulodinium_polyedra.AAC.1